MYHRHRKTQFSRFPQKKLQVTVQCFSQLLLCPAKHFTYFSQNWVKIQLKQKVFGASYETVSHESVSFTHTVLTVFLKLIKTFSSHRGIETLSNNFTYWVAEANKNKSKLKETSRLKESSFFHLLFLSTSVSCYYL